MIFQAALVRRAFTFRRWAFFHNFSGTERRDFALDLTDQRKCRIFAALAAAWKLHSGSQSGFMHQAMHVMVNTVNPSAGNRLARPIDWGCHEIKVSTFAIFNADECSEM